MKKKKQFQTIKNVNDFENFEKIQHFVFQFFRKSNDENVIVK